MKNKWRILIKLGLLLSVNSCDNTSVMEVREIKKKDVVLPKFTGKTYFLAMDGDDEAEGQISSPLRSLNKLIPRLKAGDGVIIRGGRYREVNEIAQLKGSKDAPINFIAYPGEEVIFDGSVDLANNWQDMGNGILAQQLDFDVTQLFIDDEMFVTARWPNASFDDDSVFDMESTWRHQGKESTFGEMVDARPKSLKEGVNTQTLAETGIDFTGAVAVLNINAWMSYAQKVSKHEAGSNSFTYDTETMKGNLNMLKNDKFFAHKKKLGHYYLEGLMALDAEKEWYYTPEDKVVYIKLAEAELPLQKKIRAKVQDYNLVVKDSSHLSFTGIQFFATTLNFKKCTNMTLDDCHFKYPSFNKFVLGDFSKNKYTVIENEMNSGMEATNNRVLNCVFEYADGPAIKMTGYQNLLENNLFHHIDFTCIGGGDGGTIEMGKGRNTTFRYNTVHTAGNSEGYRSGPGDVIEYNYLHNMSLLQHDGSAINCGVSAIKDVKVNHNWIHGLRNKAAIRFDTSSMFTAYVNWGEGGTVNHNVAWDSAGLKLKGDRHVVYNNLSFDAFAAGKTDIALPCVPLMGGYNRYSQVNNNIAGAINGHFVVSKGVPLFCKNENNLQTNPRSILRDPTNLDFRPVNQLKGIGPYDFGVENYWIPGYKSDKCSMPIPGMNASNVKEDADLMWRPARTSESFNIYFSENKDEVENADMDSSCFKGNQSSNIFNPGKIDPQKHYYWRVDNKVDGYVTKGDAWTFGGLKEVQNYDYNYPEQSIPMAQEFSLPERLDKSVLTQESKRYVLELYKRFWWQENVNWYKELKKAESELEEGKRGYATIKKRLADFEKMERDYVIEEASKILKPSELLILENEFISAQKLSLNYLK
ncbi:hypothetical protein PQO01_10900 [Lentisphaera marina]|uniref:hypothetical protein n=1 Tax=Lentisphaera marina TaxID=1111041 RepID=UPI0023659004|nr:hypothetical protein [Lentisphaera marina]MDD7985458.1 hypothetical protein [Lentisphaera marina]